VSKSILEKALLEAEQLEETMKSNAKEILSSTMKEEIHELVKESLSENDYLKEQEEEEVDVLDIDDEIVGDEPVMDLDVADDIELDIEDETEDDELALELPPLDLTLASDVEVLKVFKAMGDEDGIIIQQDEDEIELTDNTTDAEYIIKLEESKKTKTMKKTIKENEDIDEMDNMDEMEDVDVVDEEVVYEIELSEDDEQSFEDRRHEREGERKHYGETPDGLTPESKELEEKQGYDDREDESLGETEVDEAWGSKKHEFKRRKGHKTGDVDGHYKDYETEVDEAWGSKKDEFKRTKGHRTGDVDGHYKDYETEGEIKETSRLKAGPNSSFSRMAGQGAWGKKGKNESRKPRKANLGESRIRKSYNLLKEEVETLKVKNSDYRKALVTFKDKLNEVSVFNSNLAYVTRLFTEHSTTKQEKINILKRFDNIDSLKSSKGLYKVIKEELSQDVAKTTKTISESVESKITKSPTNSGGGKLLESKVYENPQFSRMKDLMSKL